jgi:hypothetical protein
MHQAMQMQIRKAQTLIKTGGVWVFSPGRGIKVTKVTEMLKQDTAIV